MCSYYLDSRLRGMACYHVHNLQIKADKKMLKTNEYFDGNVKSIAFQTNTLPATVGVMRPGEYIFNTAEKETVTVVSRTMTIRREDDTEEISFGIGESFEISANSSFNVKVSADTAYLCLYG
jgi:hypothetical protein